jgi:hypothetical protein
VAPFVEDASSAGSESSLVQQMRTRISRMEKDLLGIHAMAAVIKKEGRTGCRSRAIRTKRTAEGHRELNL